ncbi:MAG TPA: ABC transporter permease, partial [Aggregatilineaceae bacterium]|nr:ABC transporter permease [Aggregatilineaceae bacterium]
DGSTANVFDIVNQSVVSGRMFTEDDMAANARVVVLGQTVVKNLFPADANPIGETIRVDNVPFRVIGTLEKLGAVAGFDQDNLIVAPITAVQTHLQSGRSVSGAMPLDVIEIKAQVPEAVDEIVQTVTTMLHHEHKIKPGKDNDFQVTSLKDILNSFNAVIGVLTIFLSIIGGISLLVGGIGVMNIMLVTVTERTREIGLRKAVGARRSDVLFQFLTEAVILCFVGGFAGLVVAVLGILGVRVALPDLQAAISTPSIVLAVSVTTLIGLFFGIYPASRAAALSPIAALRAE